MRKIIALTVASIAICSTLVLAQNTNQGAPEAAAPGVSHNASPTVAQPEKAVQDTFDVLLAATQENDYDAFAMAVDDNVKRALTKEIFARVHADIAPRMDGGYEKQYLAVLNKGGFKVYYWKLSFKDGGDDLLAQMAMKDGEVGGIFLN